MNSRRAAATRSPARAPRRTPVRTTSPHAQAHGNDLDRHPNYILAAYMASGT